jgi:serine/threonine protein kinase
MDDTEPVFFSLIEPVNECELCTDEEGVILSASGSPWLFFGRFNEDLVGQSIVTVLSRVSDWIIDNRAKIVMCKNVEGDEFAVLLKVAKQGARIIGRFSEAPPLKAKLLVQENGVIADCSGETLGLLGYKIARLKGKSLGDFLENDVTLCLDTKLLISLRHRDGRRIFSSLRITKVKQSSGTFIYKCLLKGKQRGKAKSVLKGPQLRYGGPVLGWYEMGPSLGYGMCGPVKRAVHRLTGMEVAIKTLSRHRYKEWNMEYPPPKIRLLEKVRHPNLVQMFDSIWTDEAIFVVMELIDGGEFFDYCTTAGALSEVRARVFWRQIVGAVDYLHRSHICHRDIKLENMMLDSNNNLKLVDFGFACSFADGELMDVFCGSPDYAALELVNGQKYFGPSIDIWAMGVVLYIMLTTFLPFPSPVNLQKLQWQFPPAIGASQSVQSLLQSIFQPASRRTSMELLIQHEWTNYGFATSIDREYIQDNIQLDGDILEEMETSFGWQREVVVSALKSCHSSSQVATTYILMEHKKRMSLSPKNMIWNIEPRTNKNTMTSCILG